MCAGDEPPRRATLGPSVSRFLKILCLPATVMGAHAAEPLAFFESKVRPLLVEHCVKCHGGEKTKGGLRLTHRAGWETGGESGPALVPGQPDASLLIKAVRYRDDDLAMPPERKLGDAQIAVLEEWVRLGAPAPREAAPAVESKSKALTVEEGKKFWAWQPVTKPAVPVVKDTAWPRSDVDRFVLAEMEARGLKPGPDAAPAALTRRLHFTLTGLPPSPEDSQIINLKSQIPNLLASPRFAERFASHWLDVARFAESSGGGRTLLFKDSWRYRDYVAAAFQEDSPFDQFLREQIAGDLLPFESNAQRERQIVATAFLALGPTNYEEQDKQQLRFDIIDEQLDTIGKALMGQTIGCARCHDHKFDPIPQRDYYALAGIFASTRTLHNYTDNVARWIDAPLPVSTEEEVTFAAHDVKVSAQSKAVEALRAQKPDGAEKTDPELKEALRKLAELRKSARPRPLAMSVRDDEKPSGTEIRVRGLVHQKGALVPRGMLTVAGAAPAIPDNRSGRLQLAQWLASPAHPLTARVYVNRIWCWLTGEGLVRSVDNFGVTGDRPTHPALLDWLAARFMEEGWSTKWLVREITSSRTWSLAAAAPGTADPDNRWLTHAHRRRLDAGQLRDSILAAAGTLDLTVGGPNIRGAGEIDANDTASQNVEYGYVFKDTRRSLYTPAFRNRRHELFETFDFADINATAGRRHTSTVAPQALFMMNHPFVHEQARKASERLLASNESSAARLDRAFLITLGRLPSDAERAAMMPALSQEDAWPHAFVALFGCADFRYLE